MATILEKLKLLIWVNGLISKGGNKMGNLLQKVDGLKSVLGLLGVVAYYASPAFGGPKLPDVVLTVSSGIAGVGLAAKLEKGTGLVSKGLDVAHKVLEVLQKVVSAVAPKPPAA